MWNAFGILGNLATTILGYYITGQKTREQLDEAFYQFAKLRGSKNESADDRESIENQRVRLQAERDKAQEAALKALDESLAKEAERIRLEKVASISDAHAKVVEQIKK